jgi:hypothetical protein
VVINASGTSSPDVTGIFEGTGVSKVIAINADPAEADGTYSAVYGAGTSWRKGRFAFSNEGGNWQWTGSSYGPVSSTSLTPPVDETEWDGSPTTLSLSLVSAYLNGSYSLDKIDGTYYILEESTGLAKFESATLYGTYTPVSGSGATGSVEVQALNYHIEKLDYTESEYTDNLGGAVEEEILSQWEPTPLSRGPKFLDGNQKFRSARVILYVTESNGGEVSIDGGNTWTDIDYSKLTADSNGLYTGFVEIRQQSGWEDYISPIVRTTGTDPLNISAIKMPVEKGDRGK